MELKKKVMWLIFRRYIMAKKWKLFSERISKIFIFLGLGLLIGIVILYWFNDHDFDYKYQINDNKLGSFGDIIGGLIGSIWALAGYILYYVALKDQRKDIETNQKALVVQVDTLNQQIEEYKLQRDELVQTRKVLNQQSKTFLKQQFESTFFNSLKLLGELIDDLKLKIPITKAIGSQKEPYISYEYYEEVLLGKEIFNIYLERLKEEYLEVIRNNIKLKGLNGANNVIIDEDANIQKEIVKQIALKYFNKNQKELGHYFRTISNV
ncbi:MAG: hypothetical protein LKG19_10465, partial [Saprospiraceae bacterium]|nr:hypothetical protein [Saprospiraceae bacterium]